MVRKCESQYAPSQTGGVMSSISLSRYVWFEVCVWLRCTGYEHFFLHRDIVSANSTEVAQLIVLRIFYENMTINLSRGSCSSLRLHAIKDAARTKALATLKDPTSSFVASAQIANPVVLPWNILPTRPTSI